MVDQINKEVAELLPHYDAQHLSGHCSIFCPGHYRSAVAAWARKLEHKAQVLEGSAQRLHISNLDAEIAALRAKGEIKEEGVIEQIIIELLAAPIIPLFLVVLKLGGVLVAALSVLTAAWYLTWWIVGRFLELLQRI